MGIVWVVLLGIGLAIPLAFPGFTGWPAFLTGLIVPLVVIPSTLAVLRPWYRPDRREQWNEDKLPGGS